MAVLDRARNVVVLRIVYDGPGNAGKTTSVRALASRLGREVVTPQEAGERTLYFDWVDYTGGLFDGYPIRCQIVTVPGQALLAHRRDYLLSTADAVVYVAGVTSDALDETVESLRALRTRLDGDDEVPVGIVLQANKRDDPRAAELAAIRGGLVKAGLDVSVVESMAIEGAGVREAFVFAVRLALDRVREYQRTGKMIQGPPDVDDSESLLRLMHARSPGLPSAGAAVGLAEALGAPAHGAAVEREMVVASPIVEGQVRPPETPDEAVPSGMVWPPIEGRVCLSEACAQRPVLSPTETGWRASTDNGWTFHSYTSSVFGGPDEGRGSLIQLARLHVSHAGVLSSQRCVVLARDGDVGWRLWQIMRRRPSLRERLAARLDERDAGALALLFVDTAVRLIGLDERARHIAHSPLRVNLDTAGVVDGATQYVSVLQEGATEDEPARVVIEREFAPVLRDWYPRRTELIMALRRARLSASGVEASVMERLARLLEN